MAVLEEHIEGYLLDKMSTDERLDFEKQLSKSPELRASVRLQRAAYLAIQKHGDAEIRERIHQWENPVAPSLIRKYWWRLLIPLIVAVGLIFFFNDFSKSHLHLKLYNKYFEEVPYRSSTEYPEAAFPNWNNAVKAYRKEDYELATSYFEEHLRRQTETQEGLFYTGMAFLSQDPPNLKKAQYYLSQVNGYPGPYSGQAKWNLALAYLREGRIVRAKKILRELLVKGNYRREDVKELLETLSFNSAF